MRIAFIIYNGMTALDFIGVYDSVVRLKTMNFIKDLHWDVCSTFRKVTDSTGLSLGPTKVVDSLRGYDMVIVPGGPGLRNLIDDTEFLKWLKTARGCRFKVSVCTGSLLLGAAGFLNGRKATTHPLAQNELKKYCDFIVNQRIVDDGDLITAGGVTSAIDLGLYLCEKLAGKEAMEKIRQRMDYQH